MLFTNTLLFVAASVANAKTIRVDVGKEGLTYYPADVKATVGDAIEFHYYPKNHTVTQSNFKEPCKPLLNGFFSGFVPTAPEDAGLSTFTIYVKDEKPIWFYCGQADHCKKGMVGAVNAPATGNTLAAFTDLAKKTYNTTNPPQGPVGGELVIRKSSDNAGTTSMAPATSTSSPGWYTTTYMSTYTSNGGVYTTAVTTTVTVTKSVSGPPTTRGASSTPSASSTPNPSSPDAGNGAAQLGAGALAVIAAIAML